MKLSIETENELERIERFYRNVEFFLPIGTNITRRPPSDGIYFGDDGETIVVDGISLKPLPKKRLNNER